ncbi:MAG TPA: DinB family protein [Pyrinomonadaceae bacterium]|jgi:uncharacterized damage-inducible protein DinB
MFKEALIEVYERDLNKLKDEINLYSDEEKLWLVKNEISNSAGNLCQHLLGNLNHFIGALLGNSGYERDRPSEFSAKNATRADLMNNIEKTIDVVKNSLNKLTEADFEKDFPVSKGEREVKIGFMLLHLLTHFNYHLGQINYHRRLLS